MALPMRVPDDIPAEQIRALQPIVDETLAILRRAVEQMPVDTPPAVDYEAEA